MKNKKFLLVGAGFANAVIARELAENGHSITIIDKRNHVAGNCHSERDHITGIMVHTYGPHIFHTDNEIVWEYINKFGKFIPFINRVKTISDGRVYSLPINLHTINQFFGKSLSPKEAENFIREKSDVSIKNPKTFEEQALLFIGKELYNTFFYGYTKKQWGVEPRKLPASILTRLPIRFNYNDNYFSHKFQGIPENGYTKIVENILSHENIDIHLETSFNKDMKNNFNHIFWSGPLDSYFDFKLGRLGYRTLDFEKFYDNGDFQGNAVINYADEHIPFTRITEHKHFSPWENHAETVCYKEFSRVCSENDIPYYPLRLVEDRTLLEKYIEEANKESNITFVGRLGTYRYLDMDITIKESLDIVNHVIQSLENGIDLKPFYAEI